MIHSELLNPVYVFVADKVLAGDRLGRRRDGRRLAVLDYVVGVGRR